MKPWVSKKITDYIGEEEASLVDFVCEKVTSRTDPQKILSDIAMVLVLLFFAKIVRLPSKLLAGGRSCKIILIVCNFGQIRSPSFLKVL